MDLVDLNEEGCITVQFMDSRDPYGSRGSKLNHCNHQANREPCRDPYGSRGSKYVHSPNYIVYIYVEILMDLVDLNKIKNGTRENKKCRDPYGSRGSKLKTVEKRNNNVGRDPYGSRGSKF